MVRVGRERRKKLGNLDSDLPLVQVRVITIGTTTGEGHYAPYLSVNCLVNNLLLAFITNHNNRSTRAF
jgi:hypothetical protein